MDRIFSDNCARGKSAPVLYSSGPSSRMPEYAVLWESWHIFECYAVYNS